MNHLVYLLEKCVEIEKEAAIEEDKVSYAAHFFQQAIDEIERLEGELDKLKDKSTVHINMLKGAIAKPTINQIIHLYGKDALRKGLEDE